MASSNWRRFLNSADSGFESPPSKTSTGRSDGEVEGDEADEEGSGAMIEVERAGEVCDRRSEP